jgi:peptide/nickel transport system substrate-binding protein
MAGEHSSLTRRSLLRNTGIGTLGIAGAALLGCGGDGDGTTGQTGGAASKAGPITAATGVETLPLQAPVAQGRPRRGGTYIQSATSTLVQHDPHTALGGAIYHVIGEKGLEPDPVTMAIRPHVLTTWEVADPQGTTLTFNVHPDLYIHNMPPWNGRQFDAQDVAWNMERLAGLYAERLNIPKVAFQRATMVGNLVKAEAVDKLTVKVTLSRPNSSFFNGLMDTRVPFAPREMDDIGWNDPLKMAGIGPFQVTEWVKDQKMSYKKYDRYFRSGEPSFDEFRYQIVPDRSSTLAAFLSGQIHFFSGVVPTEIDIINKAKPDALLYTWIDSNWNHLRPNTTFGPFKDFRVRKAISLAIDYAAINDGYFGSGWGYQASVHPGFPEGWKPQKVRSLPGFNPETKTQDRAEANKLLAAAGYPNGKGLDFEMMYAGGLSGSYLSENAERFQSQMPAVFPESKVTIKPTADFATFASEQAAARFHAVSYTITAAPDAVIDMSSQYRTDASRNYGKFSDAGLDALINKAEVELNQDARTKLMDEFQQRFVDEWMPNWVLCAIPGRHMLQGDVGGFDKIAGTWYGYSSQTKVCRLFFVDK